MGYTGAGSNVPLHLVADLSGMADKPTQDKILEILLGDFGGTNTPDDGTDNVFLTIKNILSNLQTDVNTVKNAIGEGNLTFDQAQNIKDTLQNAGITVPEDASMQDILSALDNSIVNKDTLKNALTSLGVSVSDTDTIPDLLAKINNIITLDKGTADATAVAGQMLAGATAYVKGKKVSGTIPSLNDNRIIPGTADKVISAGNYLTGAQTIAGDANLIPANIAKGKSIFGITGNYSGSMATGSLSTDFTTSAYSVDVYLHTQTINLGFKPSVLILYVTADNHSALTAYISNFGIHGYNYSWNESYHILLTGDADRGLVLLDNGFRLSGEYICKITLPANTRISNRQAAYIALP